MKRRREIAAAPERSASETTETFDDLVRDTLGASSSIDLTDVDAALTAARPAVLALVSGGHLDRHAAVLVVASLHLSITTVSGDRALSLEEDLATVPGAASATTWTLYLPTPSPLEAAVTAVAKSHARLSSEEPPDEAPADKKIASLVDLDALSRRAN